jgi:hypothetical protein
VAAKEMDEKVSQKFCALKIILRPQGIFGKQVRKPNSASGEISFNIPLLVLLILAFLLLLARTNRQNLPFPFSPRSLSLATRKLRSSSMSTVHQHSDHTFSMFGLQDDGASSGPTSWRPSLMSKVPSAEPFGIGLQPKR